MFIRDIKINHQNERLGIDVNNPLFSFKSDVANLTATLSSNGKLLKKLTDFDRSGFRFDVKYEKNTSYTIEISGNEIKSKIKFETEIDFKAPMICTEGSVTSPVFVKQFDVTKNPVKARLYITALGLYEARINGKKVGNRYLTPGFNDYDHYLRFQTYDIIEYLENSNELEILTGAGWYKGRLGLDKSPGKDDKVWGDKNKVALIMEISYEDGQIDRIISDTSFKAKQGVTLTSSIYDGEYDDYLNVSTKLYDTYIEEKKYNIVTDFGAPIRAHEELTPELIITPKNEYVLDFKQNMVGFVRINKKLPKGVKIELKHGEVLQDECFYNANLRSAKAEASYVSNGIKESYEPMFTFFGFRYCMVTGLDSIDPNDFKGIVIHSDLDTVIKCETSDSKINQLIHNAYWGQKGNFVDVPTDCPQRDERMGWTADTQVFVNTACYNMDSYSFYKKYMQDLRVDQVNYYDGDIPMYSPSLKHEAGNGGAVWADAGTIIPWNIYENYGDKELLKQNYPMMKEYCDVLISRDKNQGDRGLIMYGFTFGDWLAQDGICSQSMMGGTDNSFIMSVYYYHSINITKKAAEVLGYTDDAKSLGLLVEKIRSSILAEYFSQTGRFALDTQCAYILALHYNLFVNKDTIIAQFRERIRKDFYKMKTGFTGTPLLIQTMMDYGLVDDAYRILFNEECPGWLYCINLGATTIWERWNSILPDGHISGINMNSLNHYAYGSVCEAIYSRIAGLKMTSPAFKAVEIKPHLNYRIKHISFEFDSPQGVYAIKWNYNEKEFEIDVEIPFGTEAKVIMPSGTIYNVTAGKHHFVCEIPRELNYPFTLDTPNLDICKSSEALESLKKNCTQAFYMVTGENEEFKVSNGRFLGMLAMFGTTPEGMKRYEEDLKKIKM